MLCSRGNYERFLQCEFIHCKKKNEKGIKLKFLLKQKIKRVFNSFNEVRVYPGIPGFIKLAKEMNIPYEAVEKQNGKFKITQYYIFQNTDYYWLLLCYKSKINHRRKKFWGQEPLLQLLKLLQYIYERNSRAKEINYFAAQNAYYDKNQFLKMALEIAKDINYSFFSYGYQEDPWNDYHHYIYYFEIENNGQVSFHSEKLFENIPEFPGKWIGKVNEKFPFDLRKVKKLMKSEVRGKK